MFRLSRHLPLKLGFILLVVSALTLAVLALKQQYFHRQFWRVDNQVSGYEVWVTDSERFAQFLTATGLAEPEGVWDLTSQQLGSVTSLKIIFTPEDQTEIIPGFKTFTPDGQTTLASRQVVNDQQLTVYFYFNPQIYQWASTHSLPRQRLDQFILANLYLYSRLGYEQNQASFAHRGLFETSFVADFLGQTETEIFAVRPSQSSWLDFKLVGRAYAQSCTGEYVCGTPTDPVCTCVGEPNASGECGKTGDICGADGTCSCDRPCAYTQAFLHTLQCGSLLPSCPSAPTCSSGCQRVSGNCSYTPASTPAPTPTTGGPTAAPFAGLGSIARFIGRSLVAR